MSPVKRGQESGRRSIQLKWAFRLHSSGKLSLPAVCQLLKMNGLKLAKNFLDHSLVFQEIHKSLSMLFFMPFTPPRSLVMHKGTCSCGRLHVITTGI